ncbi:hypothetical protein BKA81DRAFT_95812 [Phyllosticta paracitricarpa]
MLSGPPGHTDTPHTVYARQTWGGFAEHPSGRGTVRKVVWWSEAGGGKSCLLHGSEKDERSQKYWVLVCWLRLGLSFAVGGTQPLPRIPTEASQPGSPSRSLLALQCLGTVQSVVAECRDTGRHTRRQAFIMARRPCFPLRSPLTSTVNTTASGASFVRRSVMA